MEENLIERLYNPAGITEQDLGDVALLLHDIIVSKDPELDFYDKRILVANIFRIISTDAKIGNLVPTIEEISREETIEAYDASYLVEEILVAIRETSPNAYDGKDELLFDALNAMCDFKENDYITNPIRELIIW